MVDEVVVEQYQGDDSTRNGCVGKVEHRAEEYAVLSSIDGNPRWHVPFQERKVEHIDDSAIQKLSVAIAPRHECGHFGKGRVVENESVKKAVDDVPCGSGHDEAQAHNESHRSVSADFPTDIPSDGADSNNPEECEKEFPSPDFPAESHSVVLDENQLEPGCNLDTLSKIHPRLDTDFDDLVDDKDGDE